MLGVSLGSLWRSEKRSSAPTEWRVNLNSPQPYPSCSNEVVTSKYTVWNFPFKNFWEQLHRASNIYFFFIGFLQCIPQISATAGVPTISAPLTVVLVCNAIKDAVEDSQRHKSDDIENAQACYVIPPDCNGTEEPGRTGKLRRFLLCLFACGACRNRRRSLDISSARLVAPRERASARGDGMADGGADSRGASSKSPARSDEFANGLLENLPNQKTEQDCLQLTASPLSKPLNALERDGVSRSGRSVLSVGKSCAAELASPSLLPSHPSPRSPLSSDSSKPLSKGSLDSTDVPGPGGVAESMSSLGVVQCQWKDLRVGDLVVCLRNEFVPADILLLGSSDRHGIAFVETASLDGETNLKVKQIPKDCLSWLGCDLPTALQKVRHGGGFVSCDAPDSNLHAFDGVLHFRPQCEKQNECPLSRGSLSSGRASKLRCGTADGSQAGEEPVAQVRESGEEHNRDKGIADGDVGTGSESGQRFDEAPIARSIQDAEGQLRNDPGGRDATGLSAAGRNDCSPVSVCEKKMPLGLQQLLLRGCRLRNTEWVVGLVLYTGRQTKIQMNSGRPRAKVSRVERLTGHMILGLALIQLVLCAASALASTLMRLSPTAALSDLTYLDGGHSEVGASFHYWIVNLFTWIVLTSNLIPVSLVLQTTFVKAIQVTFINRERLSWASQPSRLPGSPSHGKHDGGVPALGDVSPRKKTASPGEEILAPRNRFPFIFSLGAAAKRNSTRGADCHTGGRFSSQVTKTAEKEKPESTPCTSQETSGNVETGGRHPSLRPAGEGQEESDSERVPGAVEDELANTETALRSPVNVWDSGTEVPRQRKPGGEEAGDRSFSSFRGSRMKRSLRLNHTSTGEAKKQVALDEEARRKRERALGLPQEDRVTEEAAQGGATGRIWPCIPWRPGFAKRSHEECGNSDTDSGSSVCSDDEPRKGSAIVARTSDLNEELGQVGYVFSDKTGTMTENVMEFRKCCVRGVRYGDVAAAVAERDGGHGRSACNSQPGQSGGLTSPDNLPPEVEARRPALRTELRAPHVHMPDPRLREDLNDPEHPMQSYIVDFFVHLSVNHTVLPEPNNQGQVRYSASSPDEKAFVCAARHFGVEFVNRTSRGVELNVLGRRVHVDVLASFPFDSARRRSTVLCQISEAPGDSLPTSGASSETPKGPPCPQTLPADDCASSLPGNSVSNVGEDERASAPPSSSTAARASMAGDAHAPPSVSSYTKQEESVTRKRSHQGTTGSRLVAKQHPSQPQAEPLAQAAGTPKASADPSYPPHIAVQADSKQGVVGRTEGQRSGDSSACRKRIVLFSKGADVVILPRLRRLSTHHGCDEEPGARDFSKESELDKTEKQKSAKPKEAAAKRPPQEGTPDRLEKARKPSGQRQSFTEDSRAARNNEDIRPTTRTERNEVDAAGVPLAGTSARTGQVETTGLADEEEFQCRRRMENALEAYAAEGLRTLCIAKRVLDEAEFAAWYEEFSAVELDRGSDKQSRLLGLAEKLEVSLELQGVTGIEDRLQEGVADTIAKLRQAGIHVWMLSGDKTETALNVGVATSLIHRDAHLSRYLWKKDSQNSERLEAQLRVDLDAVEKRLPCSPLSRLLSLRSLIPRTLLCRYSNSASSTNIEPPGPPVSAGFKSEGQNQPVQSCSGSPSRDVGTGGGPRSDSIPSVGNPVEGRVDNTGRRTVVDGGRPAEAARSVLGTGGVSSAEATGAEKSLQGQPGGSITSEREGRVSGGVRTVKGERTSCAGRSEGDSQKEKVVAEADPVQQRYGAGVLMTPGTVENQKELDSTGTCCPSERDERPRRTGNGETSLGDGYVPFRDQKRARHVVSPPEALIVDGEALTFLLADPQRRSRFIRLCCSCVSVICCRVAPHQKGTVVDLVKKATRRITLAIGDGANDCNMILRAHIGVGIKGNEGNQAFNCSDFGLTQFRLLLPLLLVHGRWCYQRVAILVLYIIYKNLVLTVPLFLYGFYCLFSGQKFYPEFLYQFYNICLTSTPITFYGIFEQDVDRRLSLEYPQLYRAGQRDALLDTKSFFSWIFRGIFHGSINFIVCAFCLGYSVVPLPGGRPFDLWLVGTVIMITNCIVANMDILLYSSYLCTPIYMGMALTLISCIVIFVLNSTEYLGGISTGAIFLICEAFPVVFLCCLIISTFSLGLRWFERSFRVNVRPELSDIIQQKEYVGITPYIPKRKVSAEFLRKKLRRKRSSLPVSDTGEKLEAVPPRKKAGPLPIFHDGGDWAGDGACYTADETREPGVYNNKRSRPATTTTPPSKDGARCQRKGTAGRSPGCRRGQNTGRLNDPLYRLQTSFSFGGFAFSEPDPLLLTVERSLSL